MEADSIFRKEVLHSLERLRQLENQHAELFGQLGTGSNNYEDERSRLLANVKRDNRAINQLEQDRTSLENEMNKLKSLNEEYNEENLVKFNEFNLQEKAINEFLTDYNSKSKEQLEQMNDLSIKIRDEMANASRILTHISILKDSDQINRPNDLLDSQAAISNGSDQTNDRLQLLLNEKRKLTLDLAKIEQLKEKVTNELETLKLQIKKLNTDIEHFNNVQQLKEQARVKLDRLNEKKTKLNDKLEELQNLDDIKKQQFDKIKLEFDRENSIYKKISKFENRLVDIEQRSKALYDEVEEYDYEHLKMKAFEELTKYNQKLLGF